MPYQFTPPVVSEIPPVFPDSDPEQTPGGFRLFRFFRSRPAGVNVYIYKSGSQSANAYGRVTENDPTAIYSSSGVAVSTGWEDIELVAWGGHGPVTVTADQKSALEAAGYTVTTV